MDETFGALLRTVQQAQQQALDVAAGRDGTGAQVTGAQFSVLAAVVGRPDSDQRGVSSTTFIDKSTVASVVGKLVVRGLLSSSRADDDGRRDRLVASAAAVELVHTASSRVASGEDAVLHGLPRTDRQRLVGLLRQLAHAGRPDPPDRYVVPSPDGRRPALVVQWGLGRLLRGCVQRHTRLWGEQVGTLVTPVQHLALSALDEAGEVDQRTLGGLVRFDKTSLATMLDRLERRKLLIRRRDPADGRRRLLTLTASGRVVLAGVDRYVAGVDSAFVAPLPTRQRSFFGTALRRLVGALRVGPDGGGHDR